jgi:hypothetical protein
MRTGATPPIECTQGDPGRQRSPGSGERSRAVHQIAATGAAIAEVLEAGPGTRLPIRVVAADLTHSAMATPMLFVSAHLTYQVPVVP